MEIKQQKANADFLAQLHLAKRAEAEFDQGCGMLSISYHPNYIEWVIRALNLVDVN